MFKNLGTIMEQAKHMKARIAEAEQQLNTMFVTGKSPSELVVVEMNCKGDVSKITIDEKTLSDKDMLEDLILIALRDAKSQANDKTSEKMKQATGGLDLPAGLPF